MSNLALHRVQSSDHQVVVGRYCLAELAEILAEAAYADAKLFILCDGNTLEHCFPVFAEKVPPARRAELIEVAEGEESKSIEVCEQIWSALGELGADRSSVLINLGGGVVTDLGGFIAGTFKRGIRFFNVPTSLLAQVDASAGGKTGINLGHVKNQVGLFNNPEGVFADPAFIETLPRKELMSGFAEVIKHALIYSPGYWREVKALDLHEPEALDPLILRSIQIKNEITLSDPFEQGRRKILNFGHTVGHALESLSLEGDAKSLLHGEAIAAGMVCEAYISRKFGLIDQAALEEITDFILGLYPRVPVETLSHHRLIELMRHDKKNANDRFNFALLADIGDAVYNREVSADVVIESLNYYSRRV